MTARIIVIGNQKGGVGKTTVAVGLASTWAEAGRRVMLLDCDPQQSASVWLRESPHLDVAVHDGGALGQAIPRLRDRYDAILVDLPPGLPEVIIASLRAAQLLLVPVRPSGLDVAAAFALLRLVRQRRLRVPARFVANQVNRATSVGRAIGDDLARTGIPVCRQQLAIRIAHSDAVAAGQPVTQYQPAGPAAAEVRALAEEVWSHG